MHFDCLKVRDEPGLRLSLHSADSALTKIMMAQTLKALSANSWERAPQKEPMHPLTLAQAEMLQLGRPDLQGWWR